MHFKAMQRSWTVLRSGRQIFTQNSSRGIGGDPWRKLAFLNNPALNRTRLNRIAGFRGIQECGFPLLGKGAGLQREMREKKNFWRQRSTRSCPEATSPFVYKVRVATGKLWGSGTFDSVSITLVGLKGESPRQLLDKTGKDFIPGAVDDYEISSDRDLGALIFIRLHKEPYQFFPEDSWFCDFVQLTAPDGQNFHFPCYQWIEDDQTLVLREATGKLICDDGQNSCLLGHRTEELRNRQDTYRWTEFAPGLPRCVAVDTIEEMNTNIKFSLTKISTFMARSKLTWVPPKSSWLRDELGRLRARSQLGGFLCRHFGTRLGNVISARREGGLWRGGVICPRPHTHTHTNTASRGLRKYLARTQVVISNLAAI
ncbi:polyunsaturated fatty acid lipoxygenase ALOX15B-like [Pantherophis guttatus]|uniref:Polyunsaturated fatty acid lipoxygenase ALOX15B-like n=1 Tax=Pantherophis guttatus TaxID=94885 RepID=A0ABM3YRA3_PANGU|nr:polyunsaturated fatty acid lipoxygenase ALOX15B-like [Pantherophis guttatus]